MYDNLPYYFLKISLTFNLLNREVSIPHRCLTLKQKECRLIFIRCQLNQLFLKFRIWIHKCFFRFLFCFFSKWLRYSNDFSGYTWACGICENATAWSSSNWYCCIGCGRWRRCKRPNSTVDQVIHLFLQYIPLLQNIWSSYYIFDLRIVFSAFVYLLSSLSDLLKKLVCLS